MGVNLFQVVDIPGAADKPEQFGNHGLPDELFCGDRRKSFAQIISAVQTEAGEGANAGTIHTF